MKHFFGTVCFMLAQADKIQLIWCAVVLLIALILPVLHHIWDYDERKISRWKKLSLLPLLLTTVHYAVFVSGASFFLQSFTMLYLIAVLALVPLLCEEFDKGYKVFTPITTVLSVVFAMIFCVVSINNHNFSRKSYTDSFRAMVREMDRSYVNKEWKEIDFAALEEKYLPMVEQAESEEDPAKFADAVIMFCDELHDGHVSVHYDYDSDKYHSVFQACDYGLAMMRLDSGEVIAVCTEKEVRDLGIEDGTEITKWDGVPVLQAAAEIPDMGTPVKANADRLAFIDLSTQGGDTVQVTFRNESGSEQTVTLPAREDEHTLDEAYDAFSHSPERLSQLYALNFSTKMLDDKCGYIALTVETTGSAFRDFIVSFMGESKWAREMFREKLRALKDEGMEYLIIDLRNNQGGTGEIGYALCSLLTDEDMFASALGKRRGGEYVYLAENFIKADGEFAGMKAVALTNYECISAGDSVSQCLAKLDNVTLAGITDPNGSGQMTGGTCVLSDCLVSVSYPIGLNLNDKGELDIDTRADRISRDPVEVRIPFDREAAMRIFRDKEDYELEWAMNYLEDTE